MFNRFRKSARDWVVADLTSIGLTLALAIAIGSGAGWWLGDKLGNSTAGLIIGFLMGTTAGFMEMFRAVARWNRRMENQERQDREAGGDRNKGDTNGNPISRSR